MSIIGLGAEERQLLQNIDFSRDVLLDFWLYLEKYPPRWHDLFSVKIDDAQNAFSLRLRKRRLQVAHGTGAGGELVPVLEHELDTKELPLETWLRVKIRRTVTEDTIHVEAGVTAGRTTFQEAASLPAEALPCEFAESGRPDFSAISESEYVGLISGFRFEGAEGLYVGYEGGRVVSNAGTAVPLKHEITRVNRGTENEGVFIHSLRTLGDGQFRVVEKKTRKPLEIALVEFLVRHQCQDAALSRVFPYIHWAEKQDGVLTYVMEFVPGAWDRRRSNILEVFDPILQNLKELDAIGQKYALPDALPDTMSEFDARLRQLVRDPDFKNVRRRLEAYRELRRELAQGRTVLAHNDIWGANIAVPLGSSQSRLIDIGRVAQNYIGADLLHFRKHYGADQQLWSDLVARYAEAFEVDATEVRTGAIAYAVQREIENQLRLRERGIAIKTGRLSRLLSELPLRLPRSASTTNHAEGVPSQPSAA